MSWMEKGSNKIFENEFDIAERNLDEIEIKETSDKKNCYVWDKHIAETAYTTFILDKNSRSKIICELSFHKSSVTDKYMPRPVFKRISKDGDIQKTRSKDKVIIDFKISNKAKQFWKFIGFLHSFKDLVDLGEFEEAYEVFSLEKYILEFKEKEEKEKVRELIEIMKAGDLSSSAIKDLTFENRKQNLKAFYCLMKNVEFEGKKIREIYRVKYQLPSGEEAIWHHFLKENDWILGLNADVHFINEFLDEQKVGQENSKGAGSPQSDMIGISDFTTLIELKHSNTEIFKKRKSKGRANTFDFTSDFIEGVSQCLGQKFAFEKAYEQKNFVKEDGARLDKTTVQTVDPNSVFLIGNKKKEFPINDGNNDNLLKNAILQRFRRNNRNIDILTFDELFERAYHIVFSKKLGKGWYEKDMDGLFNK